MAKDSELLPVDLKWLSSSVPFHLPHKWWLGSRRPIDGFQNRNFLTQFRFLSEEKVLWGFRFSGHPCRWYLPRSAAGLGASRSTGGAPRWPSEFVKSRCRRRRRPRRPEESFPSRFTFFSLISPPRRSVLTRGGSSGAEEALFEFVAGKRKATEVAHL